MIEFAHNWEWFQDGAFHLQPHSRMENTVTVSRVYCLNFDAFSASDWENLSQILPALPGWQGAGVTPSTRCLPFWFGAEQTDEPHDNEDNSPDIIYLSASVETSGYQVCGNLPEQDWERWRRAFEALAIRLPRFRG